MGILIGIVLAGLVGVIGHWLTRWVQGRTVSTFKEYMMEYKANTLQSILANLTASFTIYATVPEDIAGKAFVLVLVGAYMSGYSFDSMLNKDFSPNKDLPKDEKKTLADVLNDDGKL